MGWLGGRGQGLFFWGRGWTANTPQHFLPSCGTFLAVADNCCILRGGTCAALLGGGEMFAAPGSPREGLRLVGLRAAVLVYVRGTRKSSGSGDFGGCVAPGLCRREETCEALGREVSMSCPLPGCVKLGIWWQGHHCETGHSLPPAKEFHTCALHSWLDPTGLVFGQVTERGLRQGCSRCLWQHPRRTGSRLFWGNTGMTDPQEAPLPRLPVYEDREGEGWSRLSFEAQERSHFPFPTWQAKAQCEFWPARQLALVIASHREQKVFPQTTCSLAPSCLSMPSC